MRTLQRRKADSPRDEDPLKRSSTHDLEAQSFFSNSTKDDSAPGYGSFKSRFTKRDPVSDSITYHAEDLTSWGSLVFVTYTVWNRKSLWMTALKLWVLSLIVALIVVAVVADPAALKVSKFAVISSFLRVFVGLLLGFFMAASVNRWWSCVEAFLGLCGTVRKLQMTFNACGIPEKEAETCLRCGVLSVWILHMELHIQALPLVEQESALEKAWVALRAGRGFDSTFGKVLPEEADVLEHLSDPAGVLWIWMGTLLGRLAEAGLIPTLAAPSFARCIGLSGEGIDKILRVRSTISVQAPYIYVQMLSSLVHINNIVNALSFGMTSGVSVGTILAHHRMNVFTKAPATHEEASVDGQSFVVAFFFSCFGPFIYQALLEVSVAIAQPFSNSDAIVPTKRIVRSLEQDLHEALASCKYIRLPSSSNDATLQAPADFDVIAEGADEGEGACDDGGGDDGGDA